MNDDGEAEEPLPPPPPSTAAATTPSAAFRLLLLLLPLRSLLLLPLFSLLLLLLRFSDITTGSIDGWRRAKKVVRTEQRLGGSRL